MGNSVQPRHKAERAEAQVGDVMRFAVILAVLLPAAALADDWAPLDGATITEALTDQWLKYTAARQHFGADGQTLYDAGRPSWGSWAVRGDQYCSVWPPSDLWTCYDVRQNDDVIRFVASDGSFSDGTLVD